MKENILQTAKEIRLKLNKVAIPLVIGMLLFFLAQIIEVIIEVTSTNTHYSSQINTFFGRDNDISIYNMSQMILTLAVPIGVGTIYQMRNNHRCYLQFGSTSSTNFISGFVVNVVIILLIFVAIITSELLAISIVKNLPNVIIGSTASIRLPAHVLYDLWTNINLIMIIIFTLGFVFNMLSSKKNIIVSIILPLALLTVALYPILSDSSYTNEISCCLALLIPIVDGCTSMFSEVRK